MYTWYVLPLLDVQKYPNRTNVEVAWGDFSYSNFLACDRDQIDTVIKLYMDNSTNDVRCHPDNQNGYAKTVSRGYTCSIRDVAAGSRDNLTCREIKIRIWNGNGTDNPFTNIKIVPEIGNHIIGKIDKSSYFYLTLLKPEVTDADPAPTTDGPTMLTSFTPCGDSGTTTTNTDTSGPVVALGTGKNVGHEVTFLFVGAIIGTFITTVVLILIVVVKKMIKKKPVVAASMAIIKDTPIITVTDSGDGGDDDADGGGESDVMLPDVKKENDDNEPYKSFHQAGHSISPDGQPPSPPRLSPQSSPRRSSGE